MSDAALMEHQQRSNVEAAYAAAAAEEQRQASQARLVRAWGPLLGELMQPPAARPWQGMAHPSGGVRGVDEDEWSW
eukprot:COSAG01_NODE_5378_length_4297_cov_3.601953_6_plen_76_part_00